VLRDRTAEAFDRALRRLDGAPAAAVLKEYAARLAAPMRVAVIGRVSSGKSTLTNALLGSRLVPTGIEELTYNVNWLRYAPEPSLTVHFKDGSPAQHRTLDELEKLTARREEHRSLLAAIDFIEVFFANDQLRIFDLIDTPGLDSHYGADSQNTLRFLGRTGAQVRDATVAHARGADALVLVFGRSMSRVDEEALAELQGPELASLTPITAIGVLTKVEHYWPAGPDPLGRARQVADRLMTEGPVRRLLFDVTPVGSLVGAAAETFTECDLEHLRQLATVAPEQLANRVRRGEYFCTRPYDDLPVPAAIRRPLFELFGPWGIVLATQLIRDGAEDQAQLRAQLLERSGLTELRRLISSHFGNRAHLIKLQRVVADIRQLARQPNSANGPQPGSANRPQPGPALAEVVAEFDRLALNEHAFEELIVLRHYYNGELDLTEDDAAELLRVTGEHGVWVTDRLGLDRRATLEEMYARAQQRLAYWADRDTDPGLIGATSAAARTLRRSYERLVYHIGAARRHLELVQ